MVPQVHWGLEEVEVELPLHLAEAAVALLALFHLLVPFHSSAFSGID